MYFLDNISFQNWRFSLVAGVGLFFCCACSTQQCAVPRAELAFVEQSRAVKFKHPVLCETRTREGIRQSLKTSLNLSITPEELLQEGEMLKLLGFLPLQFDYENGLLDLYSARLLAYYSPELKRFIMLQGQKSDELRGVISHELVHALQDQELDLLQFFNRKLSTDEILAKSAFLEADANFVMRHFVGLPGCEEILKRDPLTIFARRPDDAAFPGRTPRTLEILLTFPYIVGESYLCHAVKVAQQEEREVVKKLYREPPRSTHALLHQGETYPIPSAFSRDSSGYGDHLGELMLIILLSEEVSPNDAVRLSQMLEGDTAVLRGHALTWEMKFRSPHDASEIARLLEAVYEKKKDSVSREVLQRGKDVSVTAQRRE